MRAIPLLAAGLLALTACTSGGDDAATTTAPADDSGEVSPTTAQTPDPTEPPVTDPPATAPPTTAAPITAAPTTVAPTTEPPETTATTEPPTSSEPPAPSTTLNPPIEPDDPFGADKQLALTALLTVEDFGAGWEVEPDIDDDDDQFAELEAEFDACVDPDDPEAGDVLEGRGVKSGEFEPIDANFPSITQEAGLADSEADALAAMERVGSERALPCYQEFLPAIFRQALAEDDSEDGAEVVVGDVTVEETTLSFPRDVAIGYRTTLPLTVDGDELVLVLDIRFLRQGRALSQLQFEGLNEPVNADGQDTVTNLVLERLAVIGGDAVQT